MRQRVNNHKCKANPKGSVATDLNDYRRNNAKKVNASKRPDGHIYMITLLGTDLYKIGVSSNIDRRLRDIQGIMPYEVLLIALDYKKNVYEIESDIHNQLKDHHVKGEWFNLDFPFAKEITHQIMGLDTKEKVENYYRKMYASTKE